MVRNNNNRMRPSNKRILISLQRTKKNYLQSFDSWNFDCMSPWGNQNTGSTWDRVDVC